MTDTIRQKITRFMLKMQSQTNLPLWSILNENILYSFALSKNCIWGPKGTILVNVMKVAYQLKLSDIFIFMVGFLRVTSLWLHVKRKAVPLIAFKRVFAGFGACSEEYLYNDFINQSTLPSLRICWVTHKGLGQLPCPSFWSVLKILFVHAFGHTKKVNAALPEVSTHAVDFLTVCAINIGDYAFYRCYWRLAKLQGVEEVTFLAASIPAFACVDEKLTTIYQQHGLMALTILFPNFNRMYINTLDEERYLKNLLPTSDICLVPMKVVNVFVPTKTIIILSPNIAINERLTAIESLVTWAVQREIKVIMRSTIKVTLEELQLIQKKYPDALLDDLTMSLSDSLIKWKPQIVAAWASTGLATALECGSLPVTLEDPSIEEAMWDNMIYAMKDRVLFWPKDISLIEETLKCEHAYQEQLFTLRTMKENNLF